LELEKRENKREEIHNTWHSWNLNRKSVGEIHLDRAHKYFDTDMNRPDLSITIAAPTPDKSNEVQLIESRMGTHKLE
jgi:hypothetical protein